MIPLVGWELGGPSFTARDVDATARLGEPIWGPRELSRDLHLRLGLPIVDAPASVRVPRWASRIRSLADRNAFYARSFEVDALGTARTLLAWRDALVDAGWDGGPIADGGDRLAAIAAIEGHDDGELPPGPSDRLARIETELRATACPVYDALGLVEDRALWSRRWQRVFALLEQRGTRLTQANAQLPGAPAGSDLGLLQRVICGEQVGANAVRGDGSLLVLRGETPAETAALTAAFLAKHRDGALVVRSVDVASLEAAMVRQGLPGQGHTGASAARPAMQVLPLALELAYEPRDPHRVLELLTLAVGPLRGRIGRCLARAVSKQPGIGGQEWNRQRERLREDLRANERDRQLEAGATPEEAEASAEAYADARLQRVTDWLETPVARERATRVSLLALAARVRTFLQQRLAFDEKGTVYGAAFAQAQEFTAALTNDTRDAYTREEARQLLATVVRAADAKPLSLEREGRIAHVAHPGAVLAPAKHVVFWGFVASMAKKPSASPWNRAELRALEQAGIVFPDPGALLRAEAEAWRRGVLAATESVVLVIPGAMKGEPTAPHPLWDEIAARLGLDERGVERITRGARHVLDTGDETFGRITRLEPQPLPEARAAWSAPPDLLARGEAEGRGLRATALETLASCPLAWVLEHRAKLASGAATAIPQGPLLNGNLSHRLVEELHREGALDLAEDAFVERAVTRLQALVATEGATLLLPGAAFERAQLVRQIKDAMRELRRYLDDAGFRIASVEEPIAIDSAIGTLTGRLDVRLIDRDGKSAVLDLKWGASSYRELLEKGLAVQLAIYARAVRGGAGGELPPAGYFAISRARVLTTDARMRASSTLEGDTLDQTWRRVERTAGAVMKSLGQGTIHVAGKKRTLPLALGVPEGELDAHFVPPPEAACKYCAYPGVCGRSWEGLR